MRLRPNRPVPRFFGAHSTVKSKATPTVAPGKYDWGTVRAMEPEEGYEGVWIVCEWYMLRMEPGGDPRLTMMAVGPFGSVYDAEKYEAWITTQTKARQPSKTAVIQLVNPPDDYA